MTQDEQDELYGWDPEEEKERFRFQGMRLLEPVLCAPCNRETIPLGPKEYPCRCPRCGTRWHTILSREQDLLSRSNKEFMETK